MFSVIFVINVDYLPIQHLQFGFYNGAAVWHLRLLWPWMWKHCSFSQYAASQSEVHWCWNENSPLRRPRWSKKIHRKLCCVFLDLLKFSQIVHPERMDRRYVYCLISLLRGSIRQGYSAVSARYTIFTCHLYKCQTSKYLTKSSQLIVVIVQNHCTYFMVTSALHSSRSRTAFLKFLSLDVSKDHNDFHFQGRSPRSFAALLAVYLSSRHKAQEEFNILRYILLLYKYSQNYLALTGFSSSFFWKVR